MQDHVWIVMREGHELENTIIGVFTKLQLAEQFVSQYLDQNPGETTVTGDYRMNDFRHANGRRYGDGLS